MNEHWIPSTTLCRPCHVDYDFIGKFEYQKMESEFLVENALYLERYVPTDFFKDAGEESREEAKRLLAGIPERKKRILVELYQDDAELFGYDLEEFLGPTRLSKAWLWIGFFFQSFVLTFVSFCFSVKCWFWNTSEYIEVITFECS